MFNHSLSYHVSANTRHQDNFSHEDSSLPFLLETSPLSPASHYKSCDSRLWKGEELHHLTNVRTLPWKCYFKRPSTEGQKPPSTKRSTARWGKTLHPKLTAQPWWPWQNSKTCLIHKTEVIKKTDTPPPSPRIIQLGADAEIRRKGTIWITHWNRYYKSKQLWLFSQVVIFSCSQEEK